MIDALQAMKSRNLHTQLMGKVRDTLMAILRSPNSMSHLIPIHSVHAN
jgi:hypothetical protein